MGKSTSIITKMEAFYRDLSEHGAAALKTIPELYTDDILFISPIEIRHGILAFTDCFTAALNTYAIFTCERFTSVGNEEKFGLFYTMTMGMGIGQPMAMPTATFFEVRDGKVCKQQDYYDTIGGLAKINDGVNQIYIDLVSKYLAGGPYFESDPGLSPGWQDDGCFHPKSEDEIQTLIQETKQMKGTIRVAGSGHSVWEAIAPPGFTGDVDSPERILILDKYTDIVSTEACEDGSGDILVTVQAGCYLGTSPRHPVGSAITPTPPTSPPPPNVTEGGTWEDSFLYQISQLPGSPNGEGYALPDLGGITHQSVGGFLSTGSAGGTTKFSLADHIVGLRIIDGNGVAHDLSPDDPKTKEWFAAAGVSMGLCGILSTVTLRCVPAFNIRGTETTAPAKDHPDVDFYDLGTGKPNMPDFLRQTDYTRMMWWPQYNFDRLVVWQAERIAPEPGFVPKPYAELGKGPTIKQVGASLLYTVLGNLHNPNQLAKHMSNLQAQASITEKASDFLGTLESVGTDIDTPEEQSIFSELFDKAKSLVGLDSGQTKAAPWFVELIGHYIDQWIAGELHSEKWAAIAALIEKLIPKYIGTVLGFFVEDNSAKNPPQQFQDYSYNGLPMDNGMDDILMPTWFTEIWIPFTDEGREVQRSIEVLRNLFNADGTPEGCYKATGPFSIELYATGKGSDRFYMDASHGDNDLFRIDVFWFGLNDTNPLDEFYPQFWNALDAAGIEYRLHWGKFLPNPDPQSPDRITKQYPQWPAFNQARTQLDPDNIFLTNYWQQHLGITK